jgi:hypothetical protein
MAKSVNRKANAASNRPADTVSKSTAEGSLEITREHVARRAYDLYLARGREPGHELEDWLQAEQELRNKSQRNAVRLSGVRCERLPMS